MDNGPLFLRRGKGAVKKRSVRGGRVLLLTALLLLAGSGLYRFLGGALFTLRRFHISGNERARTEEILTALAPWKAGNLVTLDLAPLASQLQRLPWIERFVLRSQFEHMARQARGQHFGHVGNRRMRGSDACTGRQSGCKSPVPSQLTRRVRARDRGASRACRGGRSSRRPSRPESRLFLGALRNCCASRWGIRYDGFHLPKAGSTASVGRSGEDQRARQSAGSH